MTSSSIEFCTAAWVHCLHDYVAEHLSGLDLRGVTQSLSEELTNPPAHLLANGESTVGWHYRIDDGVLTVEASPLRDADRRMVGDYATVVELARLLYSDPQLGPLALTALDAGTLRYEGEPAGDERVAAALAGLHDYLAPLTA